MQVASQVFMGITKATSVLPTIYSPLGKACAGMDLSAVHDILLKTGYKDDEGAENEVTNIQIYAASDLCHQFVMNFPHFSLPLCFIFLLDSIDYLFIKVYLLNCSYGNSLFFPLRALHHCMVRRKKKRCGSSFAFRLKCVYVTFSLGYAEKWTYLI